MSQPLVRERISARVDRDDWEVFRDIAAERGVTTSALGAAAYGQLARSPAARHVLTLDAGAPGPLVPRIITPKMLPEVARDVRQLIESAGLTMSAGTMRVVRAVANGTLLVDVTVHPLQGSLS
jgi:hypothetical protein